MRVTEMGPGSVSGMVAGIGGMIDHSKQRKRRGNLPKETTDKLRSWFVAHLHHPYPTEDEKQDLMRQTGLQMNQISNWFINARRRQLPTMINNARAESDAMSSVAAGGGVHRSSSADGPVQPGSAKSSIFSSTEYGDGGNSSASLPPPSSSSRNLHHHHHHHNMSDGEGSSGHPFDTDDIESLKRRRHVANLSRGSV